MSIPFPFTAVLGQDEMKLALVLAAVDPSIGGVLLFGDRGTGKSTVVRALASLLPPMRAAKDCPYRCAAGAATANCPVCSMPGHKPTYVSMAVPVVDLPLGATEDRVVGALDLERALVHGEKAFEPGLLARANGGFLYVDEINLLEDHLVDVLLDVAVSGENLVEREGLSVRHPARFVLIGSGNPEEGELRPQLLDRFGLAVEVKAPRELATRVEVVRLRDAFERDPAAFAARMKTREARLRRQIITARERLAAVVVADAIIEHAARLCMALGTDGLRGELTLMRAARALTALEGGTTVDVTTLSRIAPAALRHRLRRNPMDEAGSGVRVERALAELCPA